MAADSRKNWFSLTVHHTCTAPTISATGPAHQSRRTHGAIRGVLSMLRLLVDERKARLLRRGVRCAGQDLPRRLVPRIQSQPLADAGRHAAADPALYDIIKAHGWPLIVEKASETDDVIGTLAKQAGRHDIDCVISTGDKDLAQLVTPQYHAEKIPCRTKRSTEAGVVAKFGVKPDADSRLSTLIGDTVDNVPGVPRSAQDRREVARRTRHAGRHRRPRRQDHRRGRREPAQHAGMVAQGETTADGEVRSEVAVARRRWRRPPAHSAALLGYFERLSSRGWLNELRANSNSQAAGTGDRRGVRCPNADTGLTVTPTASALCPRSPRCREGSPAKKPRHYKTIFTDAELDDVIAAINAAGLLFCFDTETTSLEPMLAQVVGPRSRGRRSRPFYIRWRIATPACRRSCRWTRRRS